MEFMDVKTIDAILAEIPVIGNDNLNLRVDKLKTYGKARIMFDASIAGVPERDFYVLGKTKTNDGYGKEIDAIALMNVEDATLDESNYELTNIPSYAFGPFFLDKSRVLICDLTEIYKK